MVDRLTDSEKLMYDVMGAIAAQRPLIYTIRARHRRRRQLYASRPTAMEPLAIRRSHAVSRLQSFAAEKRMSAVTVQLVMYCC